MAKPQVNILLAQEERDVLEAVAYVEEATVSEILRPVVTAFVNKQRNDPDVQVAMEALASRRARKEGKLASLRTKAGGAAGKP